MKEEKNNLEHLPWRICNSSMHVCELMFIEEPYAGAIYISDDEITAVCRAEDKMGYLEHFDKGTNVKEIETWIKKKLELI